MAPVFAISFAETRRCGKPQLNAPEVHKSASLHILDTPVKWISYFTGQVFNGAGKEKGSRLRPGGYAAARKVKGSKG